MMWSKSDLQSVSATVGIPWASSVSQSSAHTVPVPKSALGTPGFGPRTASRRRLTIHSAFDSAFSCAYASLFSVAVVVAPSFWLRQAKNDILRGEPRTKFLSHSPTMYPSCVFPSTQFPSEASPKLVTSQFSVGIGWNTIPVSANCFPRRLTWFTNRRSPTVQPVFSFCAPRVTLAARSILELLTSQVPPPSNPRPCEIWLSDAAAESAAPFGGVVTLGL